ncbi:MAG: hypothetical protein WBM27_05470 [bacterium]
MRKCGLLLEEGQTSNFKSHCRSRCYWRSFAVNKKAFYSHPNSQASQSPTIWVTAGSVNAAYQKMPVADVPVSGQLKAGIASTRVSPEGQGPGYQSASCVNDGPKNYAP